MDMPLNPLDVLEDLAGLTGGDGNDDPFELAIGPYANGQLRVLSFEGREAINDLYAFSVTFTSQLPLAGLYALEGESACLTIKSTGNDEPRVIQGIVTTLEALGAAPGERGGPRRRYEVTVAPKLWLLTQRRTIRYFQQKTPKEIVEKVLAEIKISAKECKWHIRDDDYPKLPFVYQRDETDYEFFRRVLSDAGIVFCFDHASGLLDTVLPGAGAVAGALGSVAGMIGGPVANAVAEVGAATKMLTVLTFCDEPRDLPAVQNMAVANELLGSALKTGITSLATELGGNAFGEAAGDLIENEGDEISYDDEGGAGTDQERIFAFGLKKSIRPKKMRAIERDAGARSNWAGVAKKDSIKHTLDVKVGLAIGPKGPSLKGGASFDLDIDSTSIPPAMLMQQMFQIDPNLRAYANKQRRLDIELARARVDSIEGRGQSDCRRFGAGYRFKLTGHPNDALDREYIVVDIVSKGVIDPASVEQRVYQNEFRCIPSATLPLAARAARPKLGDELARVVAATGKRQTSRLDTNRSGYVHVRFDWDVADDEGRFKGELAYGEEHDQAVWVPVDQHWAGDGYGTQFLPREGMRVRVGFIEGHGERPFVKGCFYNEENRLPFRDFLSHQKVGIVSRTIPDDGGRNEISIDARRGGELVHIRSNRDFDMRIRRDSYMLVEGDATQHVKGHSNVQVDHDLGISVGGAERHVVATYRIDSVGDTQTTSIGGSAQLDVGGELVETVADGHRRTVGGSSQIVVDGYRSTVIGVDDVLTVAGQHVVTVGTEENPGESAMHVIDGTYVRSAKKMILEADEIVLRTQGTEIHLTKDMISLLAAKAVHAKGAEAMLRLEDKKAVMFAQEVDLNGSGTRVHLADKMEVTDPESLDEKRKKKIPPEMVRVVLDDALFGQAVGTPVRLTFDDGSTKDVTTDGQGAVVFESTHKSVRATVETPHGPRESFAYLRVPPESSPMGQWQRLVNLGYVSTRPPPASPPSADALAMAIQEFEADHQLPVTGKAGPDTVERLRAAHDDDERPWHARDWAPRPKPGRGARNTKGSAT
ncbi:contractile injection system protein, VgrG/Pvc8 family [Pendulispora albinea]|uniref:Phage baseplate assembly protein V n=1 Tax=Pendulispora albinea TaxID=2741071 RepID=A0ABZ2M698_9BACT